MKETEHKKGRTPVYIPFQEDAAWRQHASPQLDDLEMQDPDELFLTELPQVTQEEWDAPQRIILGSVAGIIRNTEDVVLEDTVYRRPVQTKFVLLDIEGLLRTDIYNPKKYGPWDDIPKTGLTPTEFIDWFRAQQEPTPALIQDFINQRKKRGGASKTQWKTNYHPKHTKR